MECKAKKKLGKIAVSLLLLAVVAGAITGAAAAAHDGHVTTEGDSITEEENSTGLTAISSDSDDTAIDTTGSDDSFGSGTQVAVGVFPTGASFASDETMNIFVGSFNDTEPRSAVGNVELTINVTSPDGTTTTQTVTTDANGQAQTTYDLSADNQNGTYEVTVKNGSASATVTPGVGPTIDPAERDYGEQVPIGEQTDLDFIVRNGEFGQSNESINVTIEDPNGTIIETYDTSTDENGFLNVTLTPQQQGRYDVIAEVTSTGESATHSVNAGDMVFRTDLFDLTQGVAGEQSYYGGYVLDGNGLVRNTDVIIEFRNDSDVIVANETATTGSNGFLNVGYVVNESDVPNGDLNVNMRTVGGTQILTSTRVEVDDPTPDGGGGSSSSEDVDFSFQERDYTIAPGENSTYDIEVTDNGSAVQNQTVQVFARLGFQGPPIASQTVTTDQNGQAVVSVPTSDGYVGADIDAVATMAYNGTTYQSSEFTSIEQYDISLSTPYGVTAGQDVNFTVRAENISSDGVGVGIPVQFNALKNADDVDSYATGEIVTNESGIGVQTVYVPRDIEPYNAWTDANRYESGRFSGYRVNVFELPGSAEIVGDSEVAPGDQVTVNFTTPDGTAASGVTFATFDHNNTDTFAEGNRITEVSESADGTITVPDYAADDNYVQVQVWAADGNGNFYTADTSIRVNASTDSSDSLSVNLTASPNPVESGNNVTLNATASDAVDQYQWDLDDDGTAERTTTNSTLSGEANETGTYPISVTAVGTDGSTATASTTVDVTDTTKPIAVVEAPSPVTVNEQVTLNASASSDNSYISNYTWEVSNETAIVRSETTTNSTIAFTPSEVGNYTVSVTVTDSVGNTNTTTIPLTVVTDSNLATTVTVADTQQYGSPITANISVTNTGSQATENPFRVSYTYTGTAHTSDTQQTKTGNVSFTQSLAENETVNATVSLTNWTQNNRITGDVQVDAVADPDGNVSEARLSDNDARATFEVTYADLVTRVSEPTVATEATNSTVRMYVRNNGTAAGSATDATITVTDSSGSIVQSETVPIESLSPDAQNRTRIDPALAAGNYTVTAEVSDSAFPEGNISSKTFTVDQYNLSTESVQATEELEVGQNTTVAYTFRPNDDADVDVTLSINDTGLKFQNGQSATVTVTPEPNQPNTVTFDLQANETTVDPTELQFQASDTESTDSASATAATNVSLVTETVSNSTAVTHRDANETTDFTVYNSGVTESHELRVSVQAGGNGRTLQGLEYLVEYPYGCVEQTTSAFLGALETDQYYRDRPNTSISDNRQERINGSIAEGVERLNESGVRAQQTDGSWNMWGRTGAPGDTFYSVYALYGTAEVANDPIYGPKNSESLDGVDFDQAVVWLNEEDQNADGSFSAYAYIEDPEAMTGFTMLAVNTSAQTERVTDDTQENITQLQGEGADYLLNQQQNTGAWNNGDARSTALAVRGLQAALDNGAAAKANSNETEIQSAIDDGREWLVANQNDNGSWDPYHDSYYWNAEGDRSVTTAYAVLALNETGMNAENATITDGTNYLIEVYENDGSWGYPRATAISIEALDELTDASTSGTMTIEFTSNGSSVAKTVTVNDSTPEKTVTLTDSELEQLRADGDGTSTVNVTVSDDGSSGTIIVGIESNQEIVVGGAGQ